METNSLIKPHTHTIKTTDTFVKYFVNILLSNQKVHILQWNNLYRCTTKCERPEEIRINHRFKKGDCGRQPFCFSIMGRNLGVNQQGMEIHGKHRKGLSAEKLTHTMLL